MKPTKEQIQENLKRVEQGKALTIPLMILNGEFKKRYAIGTRKAYKRAYQKAYYKTEKWKAYKKAYDKARYKRKKREQNG